MRIVFSITFCEWAVTALWYSTFEESFIFDYLPQMQFTEIHNNCM